jgi:hypothetical protein
VHAQPAAGRPSGAGGAGGAPGSDEPPVDSSLDPEVDRLTRRVAPRQSSLQPLRVLGLGWAIVLSLVVGLLGGLWLDGRFGTSPILTVVGLLLGLLMAVQTARQLIEETRRT